MPSYTTVPRSTLAPEAAFCDLLRDRLRLKQRTNPRYSLRAFAKSLGIEHSTLSQWLRGKRPVTRKQVARLGAKLGLSSDAIESFAPKHGGSRKSAAPPFFRRQVTLDNLAVVLDWLHPVILKLTCLKDFRPDSRWIARELGISVDETNIVLQRLMRLGLLRMKDRQTWLDLSTETVFGSEAIGPETADEIQRQSFQFALRAIDETPLSNRIHASTTVVVTREEIPELAARIAGFQQELSERFSRRRDGDEVYQIVLAGSPVPRRRKQHESSEK